MDLATIIGLVGGFGFIIVGNALEGGHIGSLLQGTAAFIVFGGTAGAVMISFSMEELKRAMKDASICFKPPKHDNEKVVEAIVAMAQVARKDGLLALEQRLGEVEHPFMRRYLQQIIDGLEASIVKAQMELEVSVHEEESTVGAKVFEAAGGYSPTIGIIGAVLGLIHVMGALNDPSQIGAGIAVAFVATVYGVAAANLVFLPLANKLKRRGKEALVAYELIMEGLLALQAGHNPKVIADKLAVFLGAGHQAKAASKQVEE